MVMETEMFFWDYTFFLLIPPLILALYAQQKVRGTYKKFSTKLASSRISGSELASRILRSSGADVKVEKTPGKLSDHYDPRKRI